MKTLRKPPKTAIQSRNLAKRTRKLRLPAKPMDMTSTNTKSSSAARKKPKTKVRKARSKRERTTPVKIQPYIPRVLNPRLSLLGLPFELRDQIYRLCFDGAEKPSELQGLLICRQVYDEAQVKAYQNAIFSLPRNLNFARIKRALSSQAASLIKTVKIQWHGVVYSYPPILSVAATVDSLRKYNIKPSRVIIDSGRPPMRLQGRTIRRTNSFLGEAIRECIAPRTIAPTIVLLTNSVSIQADIANELSEYGQDIQWSGWYRFNAREIIQNPNNRRVVISMSGKKSFSRVWHDVRVEIVAEVMATSVTT